jgi:predicted unusual protein kinase regulating ubiquinone biosynthesis (AarF/ABC1/UbiB family)
VSDGGSRRGDGDGIRQGRLRRTAPLVGLTARTAGEAVVVGLRGKLTGADSTDFHARTAERYAELLGRSKGALMKAGQLLSFTSLGPAFGGEFQATYHSALARLRDKAPPMAPELAREVLERELGCATEAAFAELDWEPLAAASIGQVHRGRLRDGRAVAVKIQYPGVAGAIRSDLQNSELLATLLALLSGLSPRKLSLDVKGVAREIGERVTEELDYRLEAANQSEFAERYRGHPYIHVPAVIGELSGERVLVQELVEGRTWEEALPCEQELRDSWAEAIFRFAYGSLHYFYSFNADPHPGNCVFHDDGSVSFLDFGCIKRLQHAEVDALTVLMRESLRGDLQGTWRISVEGGFFKPSSSLTPAEVLEYWRAPIEMYWGEQPFTITPDYVERLIELRYSPSGPAANAFTHMATPAAYAIMSRLDIGVVSLLAELRASNRWREIAAEFFEDVEPATAMGRVDREHRERYLAGGRA